MIPKRTRKANAHNIIMNTYVIQDSASPKDHTLSNMSSQNHHSKETPYGKIIQDVFETVPELFEIGEMFMVVVCPSHGVHDYTWNGLKQLFGTLSNMVWSEDKTILYNMTQFLSHIYFHQCPEPLCAEQKILFMGASFEIRELYRNHVSDFLNVSKLSIAMMDFPQMTPLQTTNTPKRLSLIHI